MANVLAQARKRMLLRQHPLVKQRIERWCAKAKLLSVARGVGEKVVSKPNFVRAFVELFSAHTEHVREVCEAASLLPQTGTYARTQTRAHGLVGARALTYARASRERARETERERERECERDRDEREARHNTHTHTHTRSGARAHTMRARAACVRSPACDRTCVCLRFAPLRSVLNRSARARPGAQAQPLRSGAAHTRPERHRLQCRAEAEHEWRRVAPPTGGEPSIGVSAFAAAVLDWADRLVDAASAAECANR
jgi:hypothetical protein